MEGASHLNREYFNNEAATYDSKHEKTLNNIVEKIRGLLDFIGVDWVKEDDDADGGSSAAHSKTVRLLDYACGTGNISRALAPYTTQCVGIDLSDAMASAYNLRAKNQGLSPGEMVAYQGDLCSPIDGDPAAFSAAEFWNFDIAAVGLGFHHFDDPELAAKRLATRLRPGGVLMIIDFTLHGNHHTDHPAAATVVHHGFSKERIRAIFESAGVGGDFSIADMGTITLSPGHGHGDDKKSVFLARGTKL